MNQTPKQIARYKINSMLVALGWIVEPKNKINFATGIGIVIREYQTAVITFFLLANGRNH